MSTRFCAITAISSSRAAATASANSLRSATSSTLVPNASSKSRLSSGFTTSGNPSASAASSRVASASGVPVAASAVSVSRYVSGYGTPSVSQVAYSSDLFNTSSSVSIPAKGSRTPSGSARAYASAHSSMQPNATASRPIASTIALHVLAEPVEVVERVRHRAREVDRIRGWCEPVVAERVVVSGAVERDHGHVVGVERAGDAESGHVCVADEGRRSVEGGVRERIDQRLCRAKLRCHTRHGRSGYKGAPVPARRATTGDAGGHHYR